MFTKHTYYVFNDNTRDVRELTMKQVYEALSNGFTVLMIK
jgi:hypothetical protein